MSYDVLTPEEKAVEEFPRLNAKKLTAEVNRLFRHYLFVRRQGEEIEVWTSCCGKHKTMPRIPRTITPADWPVLYGEHNDIGRCPYCGAEITVKSTAHLGAKKALLEYHPVIFLKEKGGALYARCYWARKDYRDKLHDMPKFLFVGCHKFSMGKTEHYYKDPWKNFRITRVTEEGSIDPRKRKINEPFYDGGGIYSQRYVPYTIFGMEEIAKSDLKYCQYDRFRVKQDAEVTLHWDFIKYMTAYTVYPKQIEMLMKLGGEKLVWDLVCGRSKNRDVLSWRETDPRKAFRLTKQEMQAWKDSGCDIRRIGDYRRLNRNGDKVSFELLREVEEAFGVTITDFFGWCAENGERVKDAMRYLHRFTGPRCNGMGYRTELDVWVTLKDYLRMAETLGYDLSVETVRRPRDLDLAHNNATEEINLRREREQAEKDRELARQAKESLKARRRKYDVKAEGYIIRIARTAEEVREEGRRLEHCVGGYAERHMKGTTTILFLRDAECPGKSLYTIEMNGNRLIQIHGYKNEGVYSGKRIAPDPRVTMAWLIDPWLKWLEKGSKRNKQGEPVGLKIKRKDGAA